MDQKDLPQKSDPPLIPLRPQEGKYMREHHPVDKNTLPVGGLKLRFSLPQFGENILRQTLQLLFVRTSGKPHDRIKHRRVISFDKMIQTAVELVSRVSYYSGREGQKTAEFTAIRIEQVLLY